MISGTNGTNGTNGTSQAPCQGGTSGQDRGGVVPPPVPFVPLGLSRPCPRFGEVVPLDSPSTVAVIVQGESVYFFRRHIPHRRRDGEITQLLVFAGSCKVCGDSFETLIGARFLITTPLPRTCHEHRGVVRRRKRYTRDQLAEKTANDGNEGPDE